jgi:hypothetical protein
MVIDSVKVPMLNRIGGPLSQKFEEGAKLWFSQLELNLTDKMLGSLAKNPGPLHDWATMQQNIYTLPAKNLQPVEVNDRRIVNMRLNPATAPQVSLDQTNSAFGITGLKAGNVSVIGYIHNVDLLRYLAVSSNFGMSVTVTEDPPAPVVPTPAPVVDPTPKNNNKGFPIRLPPGPPRPLSGNEIVGTGLLDCVNEIQVALVPLPNPWINPAIIGTNCAPK